MDFYFDCTLARSMLKGYSSVWKHYQSVCILYPLPVSEQSMCRYVAQWLSSLIERDGYAMGGSYTVLFQVFQVRGNHNRY